MPRNTSTPHRPTYCATASAHACFDICRLDAEAKTGNRTRLIKLDPGCRTPEAHDHPFWEELYIVEGDLISIDADGSERVHKAPSYASRSPGTMHGPVRSEGGCLILEFNWYDAE